MKICGYCQPKSSGRVFLCAEVHLKKVHSKKVFAKLKSTNEIFFALFSLFGLSISNVDAIV